MENYWPVIDELATSLGVSANNRRVWRQRGVPHKWRLRMARAADKNGLNLPDQAFDERYAEQRHE